jgi:hypothetical protein
MVSGLSRDQYDGSDRVFYDTIRWSLYSGIRITSGPDKGAVYGWKNLSRTSSNLPSYTYPFIYSEITGYAVTFFSWVYSELKTEESLEAAKLSADWIMRNMDLSSSSSLLVAGRVKEGSFKDKGNLSNQIYAFDNGMMIIGLLNLYKITKDSTILSAAENMTKSLLKYFFNESSSKVITAALLDTNFETVSYGKGKWSTVPGAYHSKLALALLPLYHITNNNLYKRITESLCNFAITFQKPNGRFITNPGSEDVTFLHPHLYACEGLIYVGIIQHNTEHLLSGLKGLAWAVSQIKANGGLPRSTHEQDIEQSDCMAQLLRLLIMSNSDLLRKLLNENDDAVVILDTAIERLYKRLLDFYVSENSDSLGVSTGAMRYQLNLESVCSWCTMFSCQALRLWSQRKINEIKGKEIIGKKESGRIEWLDFYI